jgi:hypothetical protein
MVYGCFQCQRFERDLAAADGDVEDNILTTYKNGNVLASLRKLEAGA